MNRNERNEKGLKEIFNGKDDYRAFVFSCCDRFDIGPYGWEQPIVSIEKVLKSSSQYSLYNIIRGKHADNGFVILSAEKEDLSVAENNKRTAELEDCIVAEGYSFKNALGGYTYEGASGYTKEKSFVVFNYKRGGEAGDFADLESFALRMCGDFEQQSVLIAEPGKVPVYKNKDGDVVSAPEKSSSDVSVNKENPPAYTSFKTAREKAKKDEFGNKTAEREEVYLPDRYETMDIAFSTFLRALESKGITHIGIVNTTGNGNIRSSARGMVIVC